MTDNCKVYIRTQILRAKLRQILRLFALALTASQIAILTNLNRNTDLHLKECELRFNYRTQDLYKLLLTITRQIIFC